MSRRLTGHDYYQKGEFSCLFRISYLGSLPTEILVRRLLPASLIGLFTGVFALVEIGIAQSVATDPVGSINLNIQGTGGTSNSALTFLGLSFAQPISYQATFSSANGNTLTDSNAIWTDDQFNGSNGSFYVELFTGNGAGITSQITATIAASRSITTSDDLSSFVSPGTGYRIRQNTTLGGVFGTGSALVLNPGTATSADEVLVYSSKTQSYTIYYYKSGGLGGSGWRTTSDPSTDQSATPFLPSAGVVVKRAQSDSLTFPLTGALKVGQSIIPITPGLNLVSNLYALGNLTLGNSNLVPSGFTGGTATSSDAVQIYNSGTGLYTTYYFKTGGLGGTGWRTTSDPSTDQSGIAISPGTSIFIQRNQNRPSFNWTLPQPF